MKSSSSDRVLFALKRLGPQTAEILAKHLGVTAVAVRQQLAKLSAQDLVVFEDQAESVGRPKRQWRLSEAGHGRFPDAHGEVSRELIETVRRLFGDAGLEAVVKQREDAARAKYRERLRTADSLAAQVEELACLRCEEGYMARCERTEDGGFLLIEDHCPICVAAKACQGFCRSELSLFQSVLGSKVRVERLEHLLAEGRRCSYRIMARGPAVRPPPRA